MKALVLAAIAAAVTAGPAAAQEADFLNRFKGSFSGSGTVRTAADSPERNVKCSVTGQASGTKVDINGTCRAAVIVTRKIGASLTYDPGSDRYTGTYVGSTIGPARLSGRRSGDTVNLTVTWPKPVNGDTKANMIITNRDGRGFTFVVTDEADGKTLRTTDIRLAGG